MNRLKQVRELVEGIVLGVDEPNDRNNAFAHLYGVSNLAAMLALQRGLDPEISAVCGLLHDLYTIRTGLARFHDQNGAEYMRPVLKDLGLFSQKEQMLILSSIFQHSDKQTIHGPYAELLKDADILQHFLDQPELWIPQEYTRLAALLRKLAVPFTFAKEAKPEVPVFTQGKREALAAIAEELAGKKVQGVPQDQDFRAICRYWPDEDIYNILKAGWCSSFVYHCCMEANFFLPIRHPLVSMRFAGVGAWLQWAKLPETGFMWGGDVPQRGDIVVFEKLLSDKSHDHIGIVLSSSRRSMLVAEGNMDNQNKSGIAARSCTEKIAGFLRIPDGWQYEPRGRDFTLP